MKTRRFTSITQPEQTSPPYQSNLVIFHQTFFDALISVCYGSFHCKHAASHAVAGNAIESGLGAGNP
ncbi:hypothetical protein C6V06_00105 [Burkholderia gladioli]|nr:hypothetical protein C6V06_00105 [Burkholderia gladioli]